MTYQKRIGYMKATLRYPSDLQEEKLQSYGCSCIISDTYNSEQLQWEFLKELKLGDTLVVMKTIVVASTIQELLSFISVLKEKGLHLEVIEPSLCTNQFYTLETLVEFIIEFLDEIRYQRQQIGIQKAKLSGRSIGRKRKLTQSRLLKALEMKEFSTSIQVANKFNISKSTLLRNIAELKRAG